MSSLSAAIAEWEAASTPYPLPHTRSDGATVEEPFRRFGDAIAWLTWPGWCVITKIETLRPKSGAATSLLRFLKAISTKHGIRLYGNPIVYKPTCLQATAAPLSQEELNAWYAKNGFLVGRNSQGIPQLWYPDVPEVP